MAYDEVIVVVIAVLVMWWFFQQIPRRELPIIHEATYHRPQAEIRPKRGRRGRNGSINIPIRQLRRRKAKEIRPNVPGG